MRPRGLKVVAIACIGAALWVADAPAWAGAHAAELVTLNARETYQLKPDKTGRVGARQLRGWNRFLRCHHTGRVGHMAPRLADLLYRVAAHFEFRRILVIAGYRAPKIARKKGNPRSPHKRGLACDFRIEGIPNETVRDYVRRAFEHVGVGYYPNAGFIHLDVRPGPSAFWVDTSEPGERARYAANPEVELEQEESAARAAQLLGHGEDGADRD